MYPAMVAAGYNKYFAIGLIATAGTLGPVVPASIALAIYGSVTGSSVGKLFAAGLLPALLIGSILIAYSCVYSAYKKYPRDPFPTFGSIFHAFKRAAWGLGLPGILLGGIYSGIFTPTESAAAACLYGWFVGAIVHRSINTREFFTVLRDTGLLSGELLLIAAGASAFSWRIAISGAPPQLASLALSITDAPVLITLVFRVIMVVAKCFFDIV